MKIKLDTELVDFEGTALKADLSLQEVLNVLNAVLAAATQADAGLGARLNQLAEERIAVKKNLTLRSVLFLLASSSMQGTTAAEREVIFTAAVASVNHDELELKSEQVTVLKRAAGALFQSALVQQQAVLLLEGIDPFSGQATK